MRERWKAPRKGNEIVSETVYLQGVEDLTADTLMSADNADVQICEISDISVSAVVNRVPIEEWSNELILCGLIKLYQKRNRSESEDE